MVEVGREVRLKLRGQTTVQAAAQISRSLIQGVCVGWWGLSRAEGSGSAGSHDLWTCQVSRPVGGSQWPLTASHPFPVLSSGNPAPGFPEMYLPPKDTRVPQTRMSPDPSLPHDSHSPAEPHGGLSTERPVLRGPGPYTGSLQAAEPMGQPGQVAWLGWISVSWTRCPVGCGGSEAEPASQKLSHPFSSLLPQL